MLAIQALVTVAYVAGSDTYAGQTRVWNETHVTLGNKTELRAFGCNDITAGCHTCFKHKEAFAKVCVWCA